MADPPGLWDGERLLATVRMTDEPELAGALADRLPAPTDPRPVGVSDLLSSRRAFWRRFRGPAPLPFDRELRIEQGRAWHRRLGEAMASDGVLEVRVRRDGLSARLDFLGDVPVEIKTAPVGAEATEPAVWPDHVEQLAIYCALLGNPVGRLAYLTDRDVGAPSVFVRELRFHDLGAVRAEAARREQDLREAIASGRPDRLERCRWFELGCEYRSSGLCGCKGDERAAGPVLTDQLDHQSTRPDLAARWTAALASLALPQEGPVGHVRDLLCPRRAYFDRVRGRPHVPHPRRPPSAPLDLYERTIAALERGPVGEVHRLAADRQGPEEEVLAWRGAPVLVRSPRVRARLTADDLRARFPQYLIDLGFRCAVTGRSHASLVVGYDAARTGEMPLQVFRVDLVDGPEPFAASWSARRAAFALSLRLQAPGELPSCPAWMTVDCPYRDACGCSAEPGRSQR